MGATTRHRWAYACSKALDEFLALAYWKETKLPVDHRPLLQHRRPAADRPVRHGRADLRPAGAGRRADHGVRRRHAVAQLHLRRRRRRRAAEADGRAAGHRPGVQHRQHRGSDAFASWPSGSRRITGSALANRDHSLRPGLRGRVRGHAAAGAGSDEDSRPDRLRAEGRAGRDYPRVVASQRDV